MMIADELYIKRCLQLANLASKETASNPKVGAVLVADGRIIGEGYHKVYGGPHAEVVALESVLESEKHLIPASTIYVSLEPCSHYGKTPPCADRIILEQIKKVVICTQDPNPTVSGRGIQRLIDHQIEVSVGILQDLGKLLIKQFKVNIEKRPYIILKVVQSKDGYIGSKDYPIWMSNIYAQTLTHKWRSEVDGIMIGTQTAITDNPSLSTRLWPGNNPVRVVWDRKLAIPLTSNLYSNESKTFILNTLKDEQYSKEVTLINVLGLTLPAVLQRLFEMGINSILVEGGTSTLEHFYRAALWDEARIITTKRRLKEEGHINLISALKIEGEDMNETELFGDTLQMVSNIAHKPQKKLNYL